jgi:CBS domain-containing protein
MRAVESSLRKETEMKISEAMSRDVRIASPDQTICEAASLMSEIDAGALPVGENDRLIGMIEDQELEEIAKNMSRAKVRRLPVVSREKRLVGIVSLGDLALAEDAATTGQAVAGISRPGGSHCDAAE